MTAVLLAWSRWRPRHCVAEPEYSVAGPNHRSDVLVEDMFHLRDHVGNRFVALKRGLGSALIGSNCIRNFEVSPERVKLAAQCWQPSQVGEEKTEVRYECAQRYHAILEQLKAFLPAQHLPFFSLVHRHT